MSFVLATLASAAALLFVGTATASADLTFCPPGEGAGQCGDSEGIATDFETGRAYVADSDNNRVSVFEVKSEGSEWEFKFAFGWDVDPSGGSGELETCTTASGCQAGSAGAGPGQLDTPRWVAVDNVEASANHHDVYVTDDNDRVSHFEADGSFLNAFGWGVDASEPNEELQSCTIVTGCLKGIAPSGASFAGECQLGGNRQPVAVGPAGNVFVAITTGAEPEFTTKVEKFSPTSECLGETPLWEEEDLRVRALAVDGEEDAYVNVERASGEIRKYDLETAEVLCSPDDPGVESEALAIDEAGHLFAAQQESGAISGLHLVVTEYDDACNHMRRFGYGKLGVIARGLAPLHTAEGDVLLGEADNGVHYLQSGSGPIVVGPSLRVASLGASKATIEAEVNPEGEETEVLIQYVDEQSFEEEGFASPNTKEGPPTVIPPGSFSVQLAEALAGCNDPGEGECLIPKTTYHYQVIATNGGGKDKAEGEPFTAEEHLKALWAAEVGSDSATLAAAADPYGIATTAYLEYVDLAGYEKDIEEGGDGFAAAIRVPAEPGELDFGKGEGIQRQSASVHPLAPDTAYRYRAVVSDALLTVTSEAQSFRTHAAETPPGACPNDPVRYGLAALLPDCRAYELVSPLDKANGDTIVLPQILTGLPAVVTQSASSGERFTYGSYRAFGDAESAPYTSQYLAAREAGGWQSHGITPPQEELIASLTFDFEFRAFSPDLCEGWIVPSAEPPLAPGAGEGHRNLYRRSDELCGGESYLALTNTEPENLSVGFKVEPQGISADGTVAAFATNDALVGTGTPAQSGGTIQLYVKAEEGKPKFACVLPGGAKSTKDCSAGTGNTSGFGLLRSANLTGALSADGARLYWTNSDDEGPLYLRENPLGKGGECLGGASPCSYLISASSSGHFWAASAKDGAAAIYSTGSLSKGEGTLYRYDASAKASDPIAGEVRGFLGASADANRVYLASGEVLGAGLENSRGDEPQEGEPNLYLYEAGGDSYAFVATLAGADVVPVPPLQHSSATAAEPLAHNGRVNPSGLAATFMSTAPLTGYDNTDASSGPKCGQEGGICDNEVFLYDAAAGGGEGEILCVSCNPSEGRPAGADLGGAANPFWVAARLPVLQSALYGSNLLSEDGSRLFFEAQDALTLRDSNGAIDVYQWERAGKGDCEQADSSYSEAAGGCVELISSGQSVRDAELLDASTSGNDVFFTTLAGLYPTDYGLVDVYDARALGGFVAPPAPAPECEAESCQSPPPAPEAPTPPSATYIGPGNLAAPKQKARRCAKGKHKAKRKGKVRCVKNKNKKSRKRAHHRRQRR